MVILITLLISAWNAIDLRKVLDHSTEEYLNDVTMHMAGEIGNTMHHKSEDLAMISEFAAGICRIPLGRERIRQSFKIFWKRRPECWSLIF